MSEDDFEIKPSSTDLILAALSDDEISQYQDFVLAVHDLLDEKNKFQTERDSLLGALKTSEAWLERWAVHVGNCAGATNCTCGLTRVHFEANSAILDAEGDWHD